MWTLWCSHLWDGPSTWSGACRQEDPTCAAVYSPECLSAQLEIHARASGYCPNSTLNLGGGKRETPQELALQAAAGEEGRVLLLGLDVLPWELPRSAEQRAAESLWASWQCVLNLPPHIKASYVKKNNKE